MIQAAPMNHVNITKPSDSILNEEFKGPKTLEYGNGIRMLKIYRNNMSFIVKLANDTTK